MDEARFWELIGEACRPKVTSRDQLHRIGTRLRRLPPEEVVSFQRHLDAAMANAQDHGLWTAAALIRGIITDDSFIYFCLYLISRGRAVYAAALADPDSLADVMRQGGMRYYQFEELWGVAKETYQRQFGEEMPDTGVKWPSEMRGVPCPLDDEEQTRRRFPRLVAQFG